MLLWIIIICFNKCFLASRKPVIFRKESRIRWSLVHQMLAFRTEKPNKTNFNNEKTNTLMFFAVISIIFGCFWDFEMRGFLFLKLCIYKCTKIENVEKFQKDVENLKMYIYLNKANFENSFYTILPVVNMFLLKFLYILWTLY